MTVSTALPNFSSQLPLPSRALQACVIIPARDEAQNIAATLAALLNQRDLDGSPLNFARFEILLGCNNCRDETAALARQFAAKNPRFALHVIEMTLPPEGANVGTARRLLMDAACARLQQINSREPRAICSTDADTQVSPTWIAATLAEIAAGAEAVGGRILVVSETRRTIPSNDALPHDSARYPQAPMRVLRPEIGPGKSAKCEDEGFDPRASPPENKSAILNFARVAYLRDTAYRLYAARLENLLDPQSADPLPRHFQFFGASLALTPRAYELVGGLPRVPCLEDMHLERALQRADVSLRHSPHVRVWTSARAQGRVEIGLSSQLREWEQFGAQNRAWLVPSAPELEARWSARRSLRMLHAQISSGQNCQCELEILGRELRLNPLWLAARARKSQFFGALWSDVERALDTDARFRARFAPVPVEVALAQLRALLEGVGEK